MIQNYEIAYLKIWKFETELRTIAVMDLSHVTTAIQEAANMNIDGVIGQDILTKHKAVLDIFNQNLFLEK